MLMNVLYLTQNSFKLAKIPKNYPQQRTWNTITNQAKEKHKLTKRTLKNFDIVVELGNPLIKKF